jgi:hypothetical protein
MLDDRGELWHAGSVELRRRLFDEHPDLNVADYAVRNLGFIDLHVRRHSLHVTCRPEFVNPVSIIGLRYLLVDLQPRRIVLKLFRTAWHYEIVAGIDLAVDKIESLAKVVHHDFVRQPLAMSTIDDNKRLRFHKLLAAWRNCSGSIAALPTSLLEKADALDRSITVKVGTDGGMSIVEHGSGFGFYGPGWHNTAVGRPFDDQPDQKYAAWLRDDYFEAVATGTPRFDMIDATIAVAPNLRRRVVYERLLLPWRSGRENRLASGFSIIRSTPSPN